MNSKLKGSILVFLGACSFGVLSTIVKKAYSHEFTLGEVTGSQTFFGMLILWVGYLIFKIKHKKKSKKGKHSTPAWKVIGAGLFTGLVGIFYYKCVSYIPASVAIILLMQNVWISFLIERIVFKKKISKIQYISMCMVLLGTVLAAGLLQQSVELKPMGVVYGLLAALSYSIFIITSGKIANDLEVIHKSALIITGACLITFIIFPRVLIPNFEIVHKLVSGGLLPWSIALALFGMVIPPFLYSKGIPQTGVSLGAILGAAELPVAVISSLIFLGETVSLLQWIGVLVILSAIVLSNLLKTNNQKL